MSSTLLRQAIVTSIAFWALAALIALVATLVGGESFGDLLTFVALILLGIMLLISAPIGNQLTAFEVKVWSGGPHRDEARSEAGGLTALGLLVLLAPQIAIVALLLG